MRRLVGKAIRVSKSSQRASYSTSRPTHQSSTESSAPLPSDHFPWLASRSKVPDAFRESHRRATPLKPGVDYTPAEELPVQPHEIPVVPMMNAKQPDPLMQQPPEYCDANGESYDVIVIGGGHSGCEAAAASARCGAKTLLLTHNLSTIGEMSCNPSIGGIGKGTLVREIDALDGLMGVVSDQAGLMFRVLNKSRGAAVWGPRAQCDRDIYRVTMQQLINNYENLSVQEGQVDDIAIVETDSFETARQPADQSSNRAQSVIRGVVLSDGRLIRASHVIVTTGTFLGGVLHIGPTQKVVGGRYGEQAAHGLSHTLKSKIGVRVDRLTTATPPRLDGRTIDYRGLEQQWGDEPPVPFSYLSDNISPELASQQLCTYLAYSNPRTHQIIADNVAELPRNFSGNYGKGQGPRYCPSIEKKTVRFASRESHRIWLEPEGLESHLVYPAGLSTGFSPHVQLQICRSIAGMERVQMIRAGYAVEYAFVDARELSASLEVKKCRGLFLAGQINGTTGYEEAAAQGVMAGINAANSAKHIKSLIAQQPHLSIFDPSQGHQIDVSSPESYRDLSPISALPPFRPFVLGRSDAYIGVLINDLITNGTNEPYRVFTARAEHRLLMRADNADLRLTLKANEFGAIRDKRRIDRVQHRESSISNAIRLFETGLPSLTPSEWARYGISIRQDGKRRHAGHILAQTDVTVQQLRQFFADSAELAAVPTSIESMIETHYHYLYDVQRQHAEIARLEIDGEVALPDDINYDTIQSLSAEECEKLKSLQPKTLNQMKSIPGLTPNSLAILVRHIRKKHQERRAANAHANMLHQRQLYAAEQQ